MCAMMPMLRVLLRDVCLAIRQLPAVVGERFVGFGHAVRVFALLDGAAAQIRGVHQLVGELFLHRLAVAARRGVADDPADAEREAAVRVHFHRHLVVRAADAARLHFEARLDVVDRLLEDLQRVVGGLFLDDVEALVKDALRRAALAVAHHAVDELGDQGALIERIGGDFAFRNDSSTWHEKFLRLLLALRAVFRTTLHAALHADGVERAADDVIADAREILDAAAANEHQRVLLEVVADAGDVGRHLDSVRQPHARHLAEGGVRLLRGLGEDAHADAALLRAVLQRGALRLADDLLAPGADELADSRHKYKSLNAIDNAPRTGATSVASGLEAPFEKKSAWR